MPSEDLILTSRSVHHLSMHPAEDSLASARDSDPMVMSAGTQAAQGGFGVCGEAPVPATRISRFPHTPLQLVAR